jgi:hypothetical protein
MRIQPSFRLKNIYKMDSNVQFFLQLLYNKLPQELTLRCPIATPFVFLGSYLVLEGLAFGHPVARGVRMILPFERINRASSRPHVIEVGPYPRNKSAPVTTQRCNKTGACLPCLPHPAYGCVPWIGGIYRPQAPAR